MKGTVLHKELKSILGNFFRKKGIPYLFSPSYNQTDVLPFESCRRDEITIVCWIEKVRAAGDGVKLGGVAASAPSKAHCCLLKVRGEFWIRAPGW